MELEKKIPLKSILNNSLRTPYIHILNLEVFKKI